MRRVKKCTAASIVAMALGILCCLDVMQATENHQYHSPCGISEKEREQLSDEERHILKHMEHNCGAVKLYVTFGTTIYQKSCITEDQFKKAMGPFWQKSTFLIFTVKQNTAAKLQRSVQILRDVLRKQKISENDIQSRLKAIMTMSDAMVKDPHFMVYAKTTNHKEGMERLRTLYQLDDRIQMKKHKLLVQAMSERRSEIRELLKIRRGSRRRNRLQGELKQLRGPLKCWDKKKRLYCCRFCGWLKIKKESQKTAKRLEPLVKDKYSALVERSEELKKDYDERRALHESLGSENLKKQYEKIRERLGKDDNSKIDGENDAQESISAAYKILENYLCLSHTKHTFKHNVTNRIKPKKQNDDVASRKKQNYDVASRMLLHICMRSKRSCSKLEGSNCKNSVKRYKTYKCDEVLKRQRPEFWCNKYYRLYKSSSRMGAGQIKTAKKKCMNALTNENAVQKRRRLLGNTLDYELLWSDFLINVKSKGGCPAWVLKDVTVEQNGEFWFECSYAKKLCECIVDVGENNKQVTFFSEIEKDSLELTVFSNDGYVSYEILENDEDIAYGDVNEGDVEGATGYRRRRLLQSAAAGGC